MGPKYFLASFSQIDLMQQLLTTIDASVHSSDMITILDDPNKRGKRKRIINAYKKFLITTPRIDYPTLVIGILDNVYPVVLVGNKGWISQIIPPPETDKLYAMKDYRQDFFVGDVRNGIPQEHIFKLTIQNEPDFFNLPHFAATKILKRIERNKEIIAELQIPFNFKRGLNSVRRIISLNVKMLV